MKRSEAWAVLGQLWDEANETQKEALQIAQDDIEFVDLMPNDMVHVVRCKDCKHCELAVADGYEWYLCKCEGGTWNKSDHYCGYGERREEDG